MASLGHHWGADALLQQLVGQLLTVKSRSWPWVLFSNTAVLCYSNLCMSAVLAYFVAAMSPNMDVANAALPVYVSTLLYFGGFLFT